jgi:alkylation response protein AidB-like acyl-CoA dehydrogenase
MRLEPGPAHRAFRDALRAFLASWPEGADQDSPAADRFRERAVAQGYYYAGIPTDYGGAGRALDAIEEAIVQEEFAGAAVPRPRCDARGEMIVATLLELGSEDQRERLIRPTLRGEIAWSQGYSEPGAGSDLAALQSRAVLDEAAQEWVIHGHKIWTSGAHASQYLFGLFRTEPDAPKHAGISYLLVPMDQPGVEVRPLRQMDGGLDFNEVFFDGARTGVANTVGARGQGWQVSRATLKHERKLIGNPNLQREQLAALVDLARRARRRGRPAIEDPTVRQRLAEIAGYVRAMELTRMRVLTAEHRGEAAKVALPTLQSKLYSTENGERIARLAFDLIGGAGLVSPSLPPDGPGAAAWSPRAGTSEYWRWYWFMSLGTKLGGGASNIQRNLIGERGLGLPRDLRARPPSL